MRLARIVFMVAGGFWVGDLAKNSHTGWAIVVGLTTLLIGVLHISVALRNTDQ
jgi:hypothetical protein